MSIKGVYQITLFIKDMSVMVAFYRDIMKLVVNSPQDDYSDVNWVTLQAGNITLALHAGRKDNVARDHTPQICFLVDDVEEERQRLIEAGIHVDPITEVSPQVRFALARDPEGNLFSIDYNAHVSTE
ncbi:MAG: VOC family protein [Chloroflexota bacterium]